MLSEYLESNPSATSYNVAVFAKAHNISYSSGNGSMGSQEDLDSGKMAYSSEEWDALTEESTPETGKGADDDSF